ncbi:MAG: hypothetical protein ACI81Q_001123 [Paracoccaceae bacterium]|jgi:hypothetical protein
MSFVRPEVSALLWRWREAVAASIIGIFGLRIALRPDPILQGFGWIVVAIAVASLVVALRRIRFSGSGDGPGVVSLLEGRVSYMGPYYGGTLAIPDLISLALRRASDGKGYWVLGDGEEVLVIPIDARDADLLFDAFAALPALSIPHMLDQLDNSPTGTVTLWRRDPQPALT